MNRNSEREPQSVDFGAPHRQAGALPDPGPSDDGVLAPAFVVAFRIPNVIVQASAFLAVLRTTNNQLGHRGDISQFDQVVGDLEIPIV